MTLVAHQNSSRLAVDTVKLRIIMLFVLVFFGLHWAYQAGRGTVMERVVIDMATVMPSAFLINQLNPDGAVIARKHSLVSNTVKLSVLNGCEGTESLFLIVAAIAAYRARWRQKLIGMLAGAGLIYLANQARIVGLWFALRHDRRLFTALHGYVAPTLIIVIGCLYYLWWLQWTLHQKTA